MAATKSTKATKTAKTRKSSKRRSAAPKKQSVSRTSSAGKKKRAEKSTELSHKGADTKRTQGSTDSPEKLSSRSSVRRTSALDAAFSVLSSEKQPMNCKAIIAAMAEKKLWVSPKGKTPHATLAAAIQREIAQKGDDSRFKKMGRGIYEARSAD